MPKAFATIEHASSYYDFFDELLPHIRAGFSDVQSGVQGDAWIWIFRDGEKVAVDTFYSMQFEINADDDSDLLRDVIAHIERKYPVRRYDEPREF